MIIECEFPNKRKIELWKVSIEMSSHSKEKNKNKAV
jgi:hypothetical protein